MRAPIHKINVEKEEAGEKLKPEESIDHYAELLKKNNLDEHAYNRLMILYRKEKKYKEEVRLIKDAIAAYEKFYLSHKPAHRGKIASLSKALAISTGLLSKKGKSLYDPEPIAGWKKRLATAMKRAGKNS